MPKKILSNIQVFNSCFINNIKVLYTNKANEKSCLIVYIYNNNKKTYYINVFTKNLKNQLKNEVLLCYNYLK